MANWAEGSIKVRGSAESVFNFMWYGVQHDYNLSEINKRNGLSSVKLKNKRVVFDNHEFIDDYDLFYGNGYFLEPRDSISFYFEEDEIVTLSFWFQSRWATNVRAIMKLAKQYNVKIKICAIESGMEFEERLEVNENGEIVYSEVKEFDDWEWECDFPMLGG